MRHVGCANQNFRRHAADIDAGAADDTRFDHGHFSAFFHCADGGREGARAGADDGDAEFGFGLGRGAARDFRAEALGAHGIEQS